MLCHSQEGSRFYRLGLNKTFINDLFHEHFCMIKVRSMLCLYEFQCVFLLPVDNEKTQLTMSAKAEDAAPLLQSPSPDPRYRPALKKKEMK